jgi:hypothetical protein
MIGLAVIIMGKQCKILSKENEALRHSHFGGFMDAVTVVAEGSLM